LVQSLTVPKPDGSVSAVVVTGGKQYRVAPGDQILVDRIAAEPGSTVKLDRVLLFVDGGEVKVGSPSIDGLDVDAKVLAHRRGPRVEAIRYKSKKRVRVHHGGRAHLTALQIIAVGGAGVETEEPAGPERAPARKRGARTVANVEKPEPEQPAEAEVPKKRARRKKESE
jgi:large subunit ribosomal protein L21